MKSEFREEEERKERVAASAQLVATQQESSNRLQAMREEMKTHNDENEQQLVHKAEKMREMADELRYCTTTRRATGVCHKWFL